MSFVGDDSGAGRKKRLFIESRRTEKTYAIALRKVARQIGDLINAFPQDEPDFVTKVSQTLARYAEMIKPWAVATASRVVLEIDRRDYQVWKAASREMGQSLRREINQVPTGQLTRQFIEENVHYITSLPLDAARRVQKLTLEARGNSARSKDIAREIARSGQVSESRATLIARTETARTGSAFTMARSLHIGSEAYIWRTARDSDVRHSHKEMEGKVVRWDTAPTLSDGTTTHAGMIFNCRCWSEPILPDEFD